MSKIKSLFNKFRKSKKSDDHQNDEEIEATEDFETGSDFTDDEADSLEDLGLSDADDTVTDINLPLPAEEDQENESEDEEEAISPEVMSASSDQTGEFDITELEDDIEETDPEDGIEELLEASHQEGEQEETFQEMTRDSFEMPEMSSEDLPHETRASHSLIDRIKGLFQKLKNDDPKAGLKELASISGMNKINWHELHNDFFKTKFLNKFNKVFVLLLFTTLLYQGGKTTGIILTGKKDYKSEGKISSLGIEVKNIQVSEVKQIENKNLFQTVLTKEVESEGGQKVIIDKNVVCKTGNRPSRLPIKLINTVVLQDTVKSIASVQIRSSELQEVREKESIDNMARVDRINRLNLVVKNLQDGSCETIENDFESKSGPSGISVLSPVKSRSFKKIQKSNIAGIKNEGNKFKIKKEFIQDKMKDLSSLLTQARGIPIRNPDGTLSFKIVEVEPGGIFSYLGVENNDLITHINGEPIKNLNEVMGLFSKISTLDKLNLTLKRNGEEIPREYEMQ
jgi:type II secretory pathway component PulC